MVLATGLRPPAGPSPGQVAGPVLRCELTNASRLRDVRLEMVKSRRDESEPLIRLADMWAGCIRAALQGSQEAERILRRALELRCAWEVRGLAKFPKKGKTP